VPHTGIDDHRKRDGEAESNIVDSQRVFDHGKVEVEAADAAGTKWRREAGWPQI